MISIKNYFQVLEDHAENVVNWPEPLKRGYEYVQKVTQENSNWDAYEASSKIKEVVDSYFSKLDAYLSKENNPTQKFVIAKKRGDKVKKATDKIPSAPSKPHTDDAETGAEIIEPDTAPSNGKKGNNKQLQPQSVLHLEERFSDELRFIKRFVALHGKVKTNAQLLSFVNVLQKAILEKRIRRTSRYARQIEYIQTRLIAAVNSPKDSHDVKINADTLSEYKAIIASHGVFPSISFIKRYINLNGKPSVKEKAEKLLGHIQKAVSKEIITGSDPYAKEIDVIARNLKNFIDNPHLLSLEIEKTQLNGLAGILNGCPCQDEHLEDEDEESKTDEQKLHKATLINSMDFASKQFETIGLTGKFLTLIGDPYRGFTIMVFGKPKFGKTYLCLDFAGYLAANHGSVLYVAKEEGLAGSLQSKANAMEVNHPNLTLADDLPEDLSPYDFIFLDSVTKLHLSPKDLDSLEKANPDKCFIYIFQSTKAGQSRGTNQYMHDVDAVIEVPEKGKAVQYGRFNQGGEMKIRFPRQSYNKAA